MDREGKLKWDKLEQDNSDDQFLKNSILTLNCLPRQWHKKCLLTLLNDTSRGQRLTTILAVVQETSGRQFLATPKVRLELAGLLMPSGVVNPDTNRANRSDCNLPKMNGICKRTELSCVALHLECNQVSIYNFPKKGQEDVVELGKNG